MLGTTEEEFLEEKMQAERPLKSFDDISLLSENICGVEEEMSWIGHPTPSSDV